MVSSCGRGFDSLHFHNSEKNEADMPVRTYPLHLLLCVLELGHLDGYYGTLVTLVAKASAGAVLRLLEVVGR